jgi:hypothetical protein
VLKVIRFGRAIGAQSCTYRVASMQALTGQHRLTAAWAQLTWPELGQQCVTDALMLGAVATLVPAATPYVTCSLTCTGAGAAP